MAVVGGGGGGGGTVGDVGENSTLLPNLPLFPISESCDLRQKMEEGGDKEQAGHALSLYVTCCGVNWPV